MSIYFYWLYNKQDENNNNQKIKTIWHNTGIEWVSQVALVVKNLPPSAGDLREVGSIPGWGRTPAEGNGYPLQYSCLENPMDRGA